MMRFASVLVVCLFVHSQGICGTLVSASGTWGPNTPTTAISAPGDTWALSFVVNGPVVDVVAQPVTNGSYSLNGVPVLSEMPITAAFYDPSLSGLFDVGFSGPDYLSLYGVQVYDASGNLIPGSYPAIIDVNHSSGQIGVGPGTGTVVIGPAASSVPEPASMTLLAAGSIGLAAYGWRRRKLALAA